MKIKALEFAEKYYQYSGHVVGVVIHCRYLLAIVYRPGSYIGRFRLGPGQGSAFRK